MVLLGGTGGGVARSAAAAAEPLDDAGLLSGLEPTAVALEAALSSFNAGTAGSLVVPSASPASTGGVCSVQILKLFSTRRFARFWGCWSTRSSYGGGNRVWSAGTEGSVADMTPALKLMPTTS